MANARSVGRRWLVGGVTLAAVLVAWGALSVGATRAVAGVAADAAGSSPTGVAVPALASYDRIMRGLMAKWEIPGGAVAVVRDGRLVLARGYGWADRVARRPVEPASLFRIASLSKSLTAAAILQLSEAGRLRLDDRMVALLPDLAPLPGAGGDARLGAITVRQLLQRSGGWDRERAFDPMFRSREIARAMGEASPPGAAAIVRYMLRQPLQFTPGTRYAYSNFGYCVLGRIIERVSGMRYEDYVRERVLRPTGVLGMHSAGRCRPSARRARCVTTTSPAPA
jgi:N-acyl-D-amino-acid deacylase